MFLACYRIKLPIVYEVISLMSCVARPVGRGHFVFGCDFECGICCYVH
jgi:hypothetical protein